MRRTPVLPDVTLRPRYELGLLGAFPFFGLCIAIIGPRVFVEPLAEPMLTFCVLFFCVCLPLIALLLIREIRFGRDALTVMYWIRPRREIPYADVTDLDHTMIHARGHRIGLRRVKNADAILGELLPRLGEGQLSGDLDRAWGPMPLAVGISMLLWPVIWFGFVWAGVPEKWILLATLGAWVVGFIAAYYAVRAVQTSIEVRSCRHHYDDR